MHARGQSSLEIDYDHCRVDDEYARSPMLWEALNMVQWSTKDKKVGVSYSYTGVFFVLSRLVILWVDE